MSNHPSTTLVDIAIPYFKSFDYLREAVWSVLQQTMPDFSLLIIDDSPRDLRAKNFIESLGDPRIKYLTYDSNRGVNAAFELAHKSFHSPWGLILGQDDRLLPNYLEKMLDAASKENSVSLIQSGTKVIGSHGERIYTLVDLTKTFLFKINFILSRSVKVPLSSNIAILKGDRAAAAVSLGNFLYFPLVMWNRDKTKNFDFRQDLPITSDIDIFFRIFCTDGKLMLLNLPLAEYRRHIESLSGDPEKKLSRLTEESNTYFNCSNLLKWHKSPVIKIITLIHFSTRLYSFLEMCSAIFQNKIPLARKFLFICLAFSKIDESDTVKRRV